MFIASTLEHQTQVFYLVAVNVFDAAKSRVFAEVSDPVLTVCCSDGETDWQDFNEREQALLRGVADELLGGGCLIELAVQAETPEHTLCEAVSAQLSSGKVAWFNALYPIKKFPLIENGFEPGIYRFCDLFCAVEATSKVELSESLH